MVNNLIMSKRKLSVPTNNNFNLEFVTKNCIDLTDAQDCFEVNLVLEAIKKAKGNYSEAARVLKINRTTLMMKLYKVHKFDCEFPVERDEFLNRHKSKKESNDDSSQT